MNQIRVNHKNLSEVLAIYGLVVLAECLDAPIGKCRFASAPTLLCEDDVFRSMCFEFEHENYGDLLQRIELLEVVGVDGKVKLLEQGNEVITIDWCDMGGFLGDAGNFSSADKLKFVKRHHEVFKALASTDTFVFAGSIERDETNFLSNMNCKKMNYIDAGGYYESSTNPFFAREFLLIIALQNFRSVMTTLVRNRGFTYNLVVDWALPQFLFAALTAEEIGGRPLKKMEAVVAQFGDYAAVLKPAKEIALSLG